MESLERSAKIRDRYIECSNNGELSYTDELIILNHLVQKFQLTTPSEYAKRKGMTYNGVRKRMRVNLEMVVNLNGIDLICN